MAQFLIRNSLNPYKVVKLGITFQQVIKKNSKGEPVWVIEVGTNEPHKDGGSIKPQYIDLVNIDNLDQAVAIVAERISKQIDWTSLIIDKEPPFVDSLSPITYEVSIYQNIGLKIKERLPAAGIDINSIKMSINDIDVSEELEITGDPYEYNIKWQPFMRIFD